MKKSPFTNGPAFPHPFLSSEQPYENIIDDDGFIAELLASHPDPGTDYSTYDHRLKPFSRIDSCLSLGSIEFNEPVGVYRAQSRDSLGLEVGELAEIQVNSKAEVSEEVIRRYRKRSEGSSGEKVLRYCPLVRKEKIEKYKLKRDVRRAKYLVSRKFSGRSAAAKNKIRVNGKFVKAQS